MLPYVINIIYTRVFFPSVNYFSSVNLAPIKKRQSFFVASVDISPRDILFEKKCVCLAKAQDLFRFLSAPYVMLSSEASFFSTRGLCVCTRGFLAPSVPVKQHNIYRAIRIYRRGRAYIIL